MNKYDSKLQKIVNDTHSEMPVKKQESHEDDQDVPQESISIQTVEQHEEQKQQSSSTVEFYQKFYQPMDPKSVGKISWKDLQGAFDIFQGKRFTDSVCKFVVRVFDLDKNGGLDLQQFEYLYHYIKIWLNAFNAYDRNKCGYLDESDFTYALQKLGIALSPEFVHLLLSKCTTNCKRITQDVFIMMCIRLQRFTEEFKARDPQLTGRINLKYEEFLELVLKCVNQ